MVAHFSSELVVHIAYIASIKRIVKIRLFDIRQADFNSLKRLLSFGSGVMGGSFMQMMLHPLNKLMITRYLSVESVPIYEIAYNAALRLRNIAGSGLSAIMPEVSRLSVELDVKKDRILDIYGRSLRFSLCVGIPVFSVSFISAAYMLKLWLQEGFNSLLPGMFQTILVGACMSLIGMPAYNLLAGMGLTKSLFMSHAIQSGINILVLISLFSFYKAPSVYFVACSVSAGMTCSMVYLLLQSKKVMSGCCDAGTSVKVGRRKRWLL